MIEQDYRMDHYPIWMVPTAECVERPAKVANSVLVALREAWEATCAPKKKPVAGIPITVERLLAGKSSSF